MSNSINEQFREKASLMVEDGAVRFDDAVAKEKAAKPENNMNSRFTPQKLLDSAGENYAFSSELVLKSNLIYDDFRQNIRFNQPNDTTIQLNGKNIDCPAVGSGKWHQAIGGYIDELNDMSQPKKILRDIILANNPNEERASLNNLPQFNSQFMSLTYDGKKPNGHSLYAFYQLQSPVAKSLINAEYYCYVEDEVKYTVFALLTEDILKNDGSGNTIMPKQFMEKLDEVKESAIDLRYASMSLKNVTPENLTFLRQFSSSLINIGEYRFPLPKEYSQIDFSRFNYNNFVAKGLPLFDNLDQIIKYYLQSNFSNIEINAFSKYINLLKSSNTNPTDINVFVHNCIYFKNYIKNVMHIDLIFTEKQFGRIDNFCKLIKAFKPFDTNSKRLSDNETFSTDEKKQIYISKIELLQKKNSTNLESPSEEKSNEEEGIISICNKYGIKPEGAVLLKSADEIERIVYVCNKYGIKPEGIVFLKSAEEIEKIAEICSKHKIKLTGSVFLKSAEEIEKIISICNKLGVEPKGAIFRQSADEIEKIASVCNKYGIKPEGTVFLKSAEEIEEIVSICYKLGIKPDGNIFLLSTEEIIKKAIDCIRYGSKKNNNTYNTENINNIIYNNDNNYHKEKNNISR